MMDSATTFLLTCGCLMMVPSGKCAPLGFGLLCDTDVIEAIVCGVFDYCDEDSTEQDDEIKPTDNAVQTMQTNPAPQSTSQPPAPSQNTDQIANQPTIPENSPKE